jgi:DNA-directed RNA polymerase specialized sigma24 family protein
MKTIKQRKVRRNNKVPAKEVKLIREFRREGSTYEDIAKITGWSSFTTHKYAHNVRLN